MTPAARLAAAASVLDSIAQGRAPAGAGTLPTHRGLFVGMLAVVTVVLVGLTYLPALALGPLAEALR